MVAWQLMQLRDCDPGQAQSRISVNDAESNLNDTWSLARPGELISISRPAMATEFEVLLPATADREATEIALETLEWIRMAERLFSVYRNDSDVSKLNRDACDRPVRVDSHVLRVVQLAISLSERTRGAFDITTGPLVDAWGITNRSGRKPSDAAIAEALQCTGYKGIEVDPNENQIRFVVPGMRINLGAIGKGYALDQATAMLATAGIDSFLIHGGHSSIVARGNRRNDELGWPVALSHPIRPQRKLGRVWLRDESLSTSGSGKQFFHHRGQRLGHVIDPRTGWPSGDLLSLTLVTKIAAESDALATGLFVQGKQAAMEFVDTNIGIGIVAVADGARGNEVEVTSSGLAQKRWQPFVDSA